MFVRCVLKSFGLPDDDCPLEGGGKRGARSNKRGQKPKSNSDVRRGRSHGFLSVWGSVERDMRKFGAKSI